MDYSRSELGFDDVSRDDEFGWIDTAERDVSFEIINSKRLLTESGTPYTEIFCKSMSGKQKGNLLKDRFYLTRSKRDDKGKLISRGALWRFENLLFSIGIFDLDDENNKIVPESFTDDDLKGKLFLADIIFPKRDGYDKAFATIDRIREVEVKTDKSPIPIAKDILANNSPVGESENVPF